MMAAQGHGHGKTDTFISMKNEIDRRKFIRQLGKASLGFATLGRPSTQFYGGNNGIIESNPQYWNIFDAHCMIGRHLHLKTNGLYSAQDLISEMDHYGISDALVIDSLSRENHPMDGNQRILKTTKEFPRLHKAWSILPTDIKNDQLSSYKFLENMRRQEIRALFLYPNQYFFKLSDWSIDTLLESISAEKVPVFINPVEANGNGSSDATDWEDIVALCKRWPSLPIIISERRIRRSQRILYRALDTCSNLHLEISAYWLHRGIEYITKHWSAKRLLFGSGWPKYGQHMTLANLTTAQISDEDKRLIAGDNLRKLVSWDKPITSSQVSFPPPTDKYVEYGRSGVRTNGLTFYDVHGHLGEYNAHYHVPKSNIKNVVADTKYYGLTKICVFSFAGIYSDEIYGNDIVASAVEGYPDRFIGFTLLNPHRGKAAMLHELKRGVSMGLRGIKLIPTYQGYPIEDPLIDVACKWANDHRQIIINHNWGSAEQMERLVSSYPNACFVTAHTTIEYAEVMNKYSNLYVCSVPLLEPRACEKVIEVIGADRLLFGTDLLDLPIGWSLGPILFARISTQEKEKILKGNLKNILSNYNIY